MLQMQNVEGINIPFKIDIIKNLAAIFIVIITIFFVRQVRFFYFEHWDNFLSFIAIYTISSLSLLKIKSMAVKTMLLSALVIPSTLLNSFIFYGHIFGVYSPISFLGVCAFNWLIHGGLTVLVGMLCIEFCCWFYLKINGANLNGR